MLYFACIFTSLLYLCCLVDGRSFSYSPNPTVGQTVIVKWSGDILEQPAVFSLAWKNDDANTLPEQVQNVVATGQTTGTVRFIPTNPGRSRVVELGPGGANPISPLGSGPEVTVAPTSGKTTPKTTSNQTPNQTSSATTQGTLSPSVPPPSPEESSPSSSSSPPQLPDATLSSQPSQSNTPPLSTEASGGSSQLSTIVTPTDDPNNSSPGTYPPTTILVTSHNTVITLISQGLSVSTLSPSISSISPSASLGDIGTYTNHRPRHLSPGQIAAIAVGLLLFIALTTLAALIYRRRRQEKHARTSFHPERMVRRFNPGLYFPASVGFKRGSSIFRNSMVSSSTSDSRSEKEASIYETASAV